jgi:hypothetical protein
LAALTASSVALAFKATPSTPPVLPAQGTLQAAFAPGDDIEVLLLSALGAARRQILVQAYLLTSKPLTQALIAAHRRGVDVRVLSMVVSSIKPGVTVLPSCARPASRWRWKPVTPTPTIKSS